jgi:tetratricopeptide (TPR) repeat protein
VDVDAAASFERHVDQGLSYRVRHDLTAAVQEFSAACRLRPDALGARCELAFTHLEAGSLDEAEAIYRSICEADIANVPALAGLGQIARRRGELSVALTYLQKAVSLDPARLAIQLELADVLRNLARYDEARDVLRGVLSKDPTDWNAFIGLGLLARQRGEHAASAALFRQAHDNNPDHPGIQLELGLSLRLAGLTERAADVYRSILERDSTNVDGLVGLSLILRHQGDPALAVSLLRTASGQRPRDLTIRLELATALRELTQLDEADREYSAVLDQDRDSWMGLVGRALVARQRGDHAAALGYFEAGLALQPGHSGLQSELALSLRLLDRLDEAEAIYRRAVEADPRSSAPLHGLSLIALARGQCDSAIRLATAALEVEPGSVDRMTFLSALYRDSGRMDEAEALVEQSLAISPDHAGAWLERGLQLRMRNNRAAALAAFQQAATLDPARGLIEAAEEHRALGNPDQARAVYRRVLATRPKNFSAMLGMAELEMLAANYDQCIVLCDALIAAYPQQIAPYRQKCHALVQLDRADEAVHIVNALDTTGPQSVEADAVRLEILRTCGMRREAEALLSLPRVASAKAFGLWFEKLLTQLTFYDLSAAAAALNASPAVRPFERSRVMYAQGMLADLEWRIEDAISWFEQALKIHADDPGAHHQLARLHFLRADTDRAYRHLQSMIAQSGSALLMRGESTNVSQNLIGQLLNEQRLDGELRSRLAVLSDMEPRSRIDILAGLVRSSPWLTPPAVSLMLALRQSGAFGSAAELAADTQGALTIPRKIMQYWDQKNPLDEVTRLLRTWVEAHPGYAYSRFDNMAAREYLAAHYAKEVLNAYRQARHPAQASDLFRLAYLLREGGFYIDADDRCVGNLATISAPGFVLIGYQEQYATLGNNFLACTPGEAVIEHALKLAVESLNRGDSDAIWLATGPGLLTRAFTEILSTQGTDWRPWLQQRRILDRNELAKVSWSHSISQYKNTRRSWLRSAFKARPPSQTKIPA